MIPSGQCIDGVLGARRPRHILIQMTQRQLVTLNGWKESAPSRNRG